jgi:radical SAM superfamily enzyme YgiQ (UPF0313 family)
MKILFIYPGYENLGIEYLSSALIKNGHQTFLIFDPVLFNECGSIRIRFLSFLLDYTKTILKRIAHINPDLICFSCVSDNFKWMLDIAGKIKANFDIPIIAGGIHPTSVPDLVINNDLIDFICVGEGDEAIVELINKMQIGDDRRIRNIWSKKEGVIIPNDIRPLIENLDSLPFPDKDLYYKEYKFFSRGYLIATSRGCPHSCTYCSNSLLREIYRDKGKYLRRRSVGNVIEELSRSMKKYKPRYVHFCDEVFTTDKIWLREFVDLYKKNINLPFACYSSPLFIDEQTAGLLGEGGCYKLQIGVQTLNENTRRNLLNRWYTNQEIEKTIKIAKKNKIYLTCDNILGLPGESEQDLIEMAKFYNLNMPNHIEIFWLRYYPCTAILDKVFNSTTLKNSGPQKPELYIEPRGIATGGDTYRKELAKFHFLFSIFPLLPAVMRRVILNKRLYRFFPFLKPIWVILLFKYLNKAKFDLFTDSTMSRYIFFCRNLFKL